MSSDHDHVQSVVSILRLSDSRYQISAAVPPITGCATVEFGDAATVDVDALDHNRLVSMAVDVSTDVGRGVAAAWFGESAVNLWDDGDLSAVALAAGPAAEAMGQAAVCDLFADIDHPLQTGLWLAQELLALARAEANEPRLRVERRDLLALATDALERVVESFAGPADLALVHDAAQVLMRSRPGVDLGDRLVAVHRRTTAVADEARVGRGDARQDLALTLGQTDPGPTRPRRPRLDILPVIARLSFRSEVRFGPRSQVLIDRNGSEADITITDVVDFPRQDGRSPVRVLLRARAVDADGAGSHVDLVRVGFDPETATATTRIALDEVLIRDARFVILDIASSDPPPSPSEYAAAIVRCEAHIARLLAELPVRRGEVQQHWDNAVDASLLLPDGTQRLVFEAQLQAVRTRTQLSFATLALRVRLDVPNV